MLFNVGKMRSGGVKKTHCLRLEKLPLFRPGKTVTPEKSVTVQACMENLSLSKPAWKTCHCLCLEEVSLSRSGNSVTFQAWKKCHCPGPEKLSLPEIISSAIQVMDICTDAGLKYLFSPKNYCPKCLIFIIN